MQNLRMNLKVKNYRLEDLPTPPFSIYKINEYGEIYPKQVFTVIKKYKDEATLNIKLTLMESNETIDYDHQTVNVVAQRFLN